MKMLVTARDSQTGTGKTTLAVALAKSWDEHGWDVSKATLSPSDYVDTYTELNTGEILIGDEMEQMADPRRSMSEQNVTLTQYWSTMRQWEVSTICTLPSMAMVDKRLRELCDLRVNVIDRGIAVAYKTKIDDHSGDIREKRLHRIRWNALDDDEDYQELSDMKERHMENFNETAYFKADDEDDGPKDPEEAIKEYRDERMTEAYSAGEWDQQELANIFDVSRPRVSQIVNADSDD
jgi:predicted XRE-type DNA-binding protein